MQPHATVSPLSLPYVFVCCQSLGLLLTLYLVFITMHALPPSLLMVCHTTGTYLNFTVVTCRLTVKWQRDTKQAPSNNNQALLLHKGGAYISINRGSQNESS